MIPSLMEALSYIHVCYCQCIASSLENILKREKQEWNQNRTGNRTGKRPRGTAICMYIQCMLASFLIFAGDISKPEEIFHIIEHFCLGRRRLHLFGNDNSIRPGLYIIKDWRLALWFCYNSTLVLFIVGARLYYYRGFPRDSPSNYH